MRLEQTLQQPLHAWRCLFPTSVSLREVMQVTCRPGFNHAPIARQGFHAPLPSADVDAQYYRPMLAEMQRVQQQVETLMAAHATRQHHTPRPASPPPFPTAPHPTQLITQHTALATAAQRTWMRRGSYPRKPDALAIARHRLQVPRSSHCPEASDRLTWVKHMITFTQSEPTYLPSTATQAAGTSDVTVNADKYAIPSTPTVE